ncbi:MAG: hypothetical protein IPO88_32600 [Nannocystis sp.]|uniref:hypothetical protein n=1 Tax=Nannocystis sp. TaxID=1962667 RepID=UPI002420A327|nr:hypothetical protein [Nannocystis sp.]MBK9758174.1 hypothetical protein [Nannocystis sp.]
MSIRVACLITTLIIAAGCDPEGSAVTGGATKSGAAGQAVPGDGQVAAPHAAPPHAATPHDATPHDATPPVVAADVRPTDSASERSEFSNCLLACDASTLKHADKAACRFNCDKGGAGGDPAAVVGSDPVEYVMRCMDRCYSGDKASESCLGSCKSAVVALPAAPSSAVLDALGACLKPCRGGTGMIETNRATCELTCAQEARLAGPKTP